MICYGDHVTQVAGRSAELDSSDADFAELVGRPSGSLAAAGGGAAGPDRWTGFEYTPVHSSYR